MSQPDSPINKCRICHERSTWDFLREFYSRVEAAHEYARGLEHDLYQATSLAQHSQHALTQCEASLAASWDLLNEERLDHRAAQEELAFERERHMETMELLEKVFQEAMNSGEIADILRHEIATIRAASSLGVTQASPEAPKPLIEASERLSSPETSSINQRSKPANTLLVECAGSQQECAPSDVDERQYATLPPSNDPQNVSESSCYITSGATEKPRPVRDAAAKVPRKSKPVSKRKRARLPGSLEC